MRRVLFGFGSTGASAASYTVVSLPLGLGRSAALGIGMQSLKLSDWRANYGQPAMLQRLAPPWLRVAATQEPGAFFAGSLDLQAAIDAARADEPGGTDDDDAADD